MKKTILLITAVFVLMRLHAQDEEHEFHWTKEKTEFANIIVQEAGPGTIQNCVYVSGKIITHPDHVAYVIPKVSGCVFQVRKNLGDVVEKDEVLAIVESKEIAEAKSHYLTAQKQYSLYQTLWDKERSLKGISTQQKVLKAQLAAQEAEIHLELAKQNLYALGFTEQDLANIDKKGVTQLRYYEIKAPMKGKILERDLTLGEVTNHSTRAFIVADVEKVGVEIKISQNDAQYLKQGQVVEVISNGKIAQATICQFSPLINDETRMATAIALMDNPSQKWSAGEFVTATIQTDAAQAAVTVPLSALQMIGGKQCIFVENGEEFIPCAVRLGKMDHLNAEVLSGLAPGTVYAADNTFVLKAEFEKEEAEE